MIQLRPPTLSRLMPALIIGQAIIDAGPGSGAIRGRRTGLVEAT